MRLFNNGMKLGGGILLGVGAVLVAPLVVPAFSGVLRTLAKSAIKGGLLMYETGKLAMAEAKESFEDLAAEAKAEHAQEMQAAAATSEAAATAMKPTSAKKKAAPRKRQVIKEDPGSETA